MNKRQKIVQKQFLNNEAEVLRRLEETYGRAQKDVLKRIANLRIDIDELNDTWADFEGTPEEKDVLRSRIQSKIYQQKHQKAIQGQIDDVLNKMHKGAYTSVSEYLEKCYEDGFIGTLYDIQGQGVPFVFPIDQEAVARAVQIDSKISKNLYTKMGENVSDLKKHITAEVSRGLANGSSYEQVAQQISLRMTGTYNKNGGALARAQTIARTEGHRVEVESTMDACYKAKDKGADVVKQWDSTLDARTRDSHVKVDGEIKELDEKFSNGLRFPSDSTGGAAEVVNCRCALLQRARWALSDDEFTKMNGFTGELETFNKDRSYSDFKKDFFSKENREYMTYVEGLEQKYGTRDFEKLLGALNDKEYKRYTELFNKNPMYVKKAAASTQKTAVAVNYNCELAQKFGKDYFDEMQKLVQNSPDKNLSEVWRKYEDGVKVGDANYKGHEHCMGSTIYVNGAKDAKGNSWQAPFQVTFHESGHAIDNLASKHPSVANSKVFSRHYSAAYKDGLFPKTIENEVADWVKAKDKELKALFKAHADDVEFMHKNGFISNWSYDMYKRGVYTAADITPKYRKSFAYSAIQKEIYALPKLDRADLSDIFEGATKGKIQCGFGHGKKYWSDRTFGGVSDGLATETFAEMIDSTFTCPESLATIQKYLPKSYALFQEMIDNLL